MIPTYSLVRGAEAVDIRRRTAARLHELVQTVAGALWVATLRDDAVDGGEHEKLCELHGSGLGGDGAWV